MAVTHRAQAGSNGPRHRERLLQLARERGVVRTRDLAALGVPRVYLRRLVAQGALERAGRGLYILAGFDVTEHHTLAEVGAKVPAGIVCLLSALAYHVIGTQLPHQVWLAIPMKARRPQVTDLPIRIVRFSGASLVAGVEPRRIEGVTIRVTNPARTVVDCFRFRNKIGLEVAVEALKEGWRDRRFTMDELHEIATGLRSAKVMRPYLEMLA